MFKLLKYAKNYRKQIILGPFFKFLEACFELVLPLFMAQLVDQGIQQNNTVYILKMAGMMLLMSIIGLICVIICQYYASVASQGFGTELRKQLMKKINTLSHNELNSFGTDTLITRMTNDVNQLQLALAMLIRLVIRAPFLSIGSVIMAFYINVQIGFIFLIVLPIFCIILFIIIKYTVPWYGKLQKKMDYLNQSIAQSLSGVRVIRAFSRQKKEQEQIETISDDIANQTIHVTNLSALLTPATTLVMNIGIISVLYLGGIKVNIGELKQGEVLALINYMNQMLLALIVVSNLVMIFAKASASSQRITEIFEVVPSISNKPINQTNEAITEKIIFEEVSFRYQSTAGLVLDTISLTIAKNSVLGITGATGSGKSTLTQLIPRFYDVTEGNIFVDGINVRDWGIEQLRQNIVMAPQKAVLFTGTIRENLQWGKSNATDQECWTALEIAQCKEFVKNLSNGLDTQVYEGGKNFSGGQKQRLTIARAIINRPTILILDDSLSALDYQTDLHLRTALRKHLTHTTMIIVSQRISSIQSADQILVLSSGKQAGLGTHKFLLQHSKEYQAIVSSQEEDAKGYDQK